MTTQTDKRGETSSGESGGPGAKAADPPKPKWFSRRWHVWKKYLGHPFFGVMTFLLLAVGVAWGAFEKIYGRDLALLAKYQEIGSPEGIKDKLEAKAEELCKRRVWLLVEDFGKPKTYTCGGTTFTYSARRVEEEAGKCGVRNYFVGDAEETKEHYPIEFKLSGVNEKGEKRECVFPAQMENSVESDLCGCELIATNPTIAVTSDRLVFRALLEPLP